MLFRILLSDVAFRTYRELAQTNVKKHRKIKKTLGLMEANVRHPFLQTHEYITLSGPNGEKVFEAYAENKTPGTYRVFWHYGPGANVITVIAITPHP